MVDVSVWDGRCVWDGSCECYGMVVVSVMGWVVVLWDGKLTH